MPSLKLTSQIVQKIATVWATFFYSGYLPKGSGTLATFLTIPLVYGLSYVPDLVGIVAILLVITTGIFSCEIYLQNASKESSQDPSELVIDEVAGFLVAMALVPWSVKSLIVGFVLFRLLDIFKPFPISYLDQNVKGGLGVMVDDLAAGFITSLVLQAGLYFQLL